MERGRPGRTYILGGPHHTVQQVFGRAGRLAGRRREPIPVPASLLRPPAVGLGILGRVFGALSGPAERLRLAAGVTHLGDDSRARRELGYEPRPLSEGLPDTVRGLLEQLMDEVA
jgi:dihydroflavonol-4-reductase